MSYRRVIEDDHSFVRMKSFLLPHRLAVLALACAFPALADAGLITFDTLTAGSGGAVIGNGYSGFNWSNMDVENTTTVPQSGYAAGAVSLNNVAFNGAGSAASMLGIGGALFDFNSAYLTGAWSDALNIQVQGFKGGNLLYTQTFAANATSPTFETFNYLGVDTVTFTSSGGLHHVGYAGSGTQFAMDNVTVNAAVPEPATALFGVAIVGVLGASRKRSVRADAQ
jgi:hypothetical protein